ncbi:hypothetical protein Fot_46458 [Forsythia ovata]|uniref:Uncharacterized protein n=1 Tax=Forsythia ovata TaxID=205694 RepID=A0ABD1QR63_9LAMI
MVVSVRADLQRERAAHSEEPAPQREHSASAIHWRRLRANGGILCARKAHREKIYSARGLPTARNQPHSASASHRRRRLGANGGNFSARKGHREETHSSIGEFTARKQPHSASAFSGGGYGVQRRWVWGSPEVAVGWGISRARNWGKTEGERRETEMGRGWGGCSLFWTICPSGILITVSKAK